VVTYGEHNDFHRMKECKIDRRLAVTQGRTQDGADGAKAPPEIPRKKLFTHSNPEHFMFRSLYKEVSSVSQSFYNNRLYRLLIN